MRMRRIKKYSFVVLASLFLVSLFAVEYSALADETTRPTLILESYIISGNMSKGEDFVLEYTLRNTSRTATVNNILFAIQPSGGVFYPSDGRGNQYYIASISSEDTYTGEVYLSINPAAPDGTYNLEYILSYQGGTDALITNSGFVSLKIASLAIEILDINLPEQCFEGRPTFFSVRYANNGTKELRDVRVMLDGNIEEGSEILIGTVRPGITSIAEGYVTFLSTGEQTLNCYITHLSEDGAVVSFAPQTQSTVVTGIFSSEQDNETTHQDEQEPPNGIVALLRDNVIFVIVGVGLACIIVIFVSILRRKRK